MGESSEMFPKQQGTAPSLRPVHTGIGWNVSNAAKERQWPTLCWFPAADAVVRQAVSSTQYSQPFALCTKCRPPRAPSTPQFLWENALLLLPSTKSTFHPSVLVRECTVSSPFHQEHLPPLSSCERMHCFFSLPPRAECGQVKRRCMCLTSPEIKMTKKMKNKDQTVCSSGSKYSWLLNAGKGGGGGGVQWRWWCCWPRFLPRLPPTPPPPPPPLPLWWCWWLLYPRLPLRWWTWLKSLLVMLLLFRKSKVCCAGSGKKLLVGGNTITSSSSARAEKGGRGWEGLGGWRDSVSSGWEEVSISFCSSSRLFRRKNPHWKHKEVKVMTNLPSVCES